MFGFGPFELLIFLGFGLFILAGIAVVYFVVRMAIRAENSKNNDLK